MGMTGVRNLKAWAALLVVGLLGTLLVLALSACGGAGAGGQEEAKGRPLPLYPTEKALSPGEYHSVKFKPRSPSRSARAGQTLQISCPNLSNWGSKERLGF
jgi:hypothetical protein